MPLNNLVSPPEESPYEKLRKLLVDSVTPKSAEAMYIGEQGTGYDSASMQGRAFSSQYDKLPRFEISDAESNISIPADTVRDWYRMGRGVYTGKLGDVFRHDKLYQQYPEMRDIPLNIHIDKNGDSLTLGAFDPKTGGISLYANSPEKASQQFRDTLLHESQHFIQAKEGMNTGANLASGIFLKSSLDYKLDDLNRDRQKLIEFILERQTKGSKKGWDTYKTSITGVTPKFEKSPFLAVVSDVDDPAASNLSEFALPRMKSVETLEQAMNELSKIESRIGELSKITKKVSGEGELSAAFKDYKNFAGEIEARDTAFRADMTDEERKAVAPYSGENISTDDAIVILNRAVAKK